MTGREGAGTTVEDYLAAVPQPQRAALEQLRAIIRAVAPEAEEVISYGIPTFRFHGPLVSYGAFKDHCSLFGLTGAMRELMGDALHGYSVSKGTVRFQPEAPLPRAVIEKFVLARADQNLAAEAARKEARSRAPRQT